MIENAPNFERLIRTAFWTLLVLTVILTSYGFIVEEFGFGLFLRDDPAPKLHMRGEAHIASALSLAATLGLFIASMMVRRWSRVLPGVGFTGCAIGLWYCRLPRF